MITEPMALDKSLARADSWEKWTENQNYFSNHNGVSFLPVEKSVYSHRPQQLLWYL